MVRPDPAVRDQSARRLGVAVSEEGHSMSPLYESVSEHVDDPLDPPVKDRRNGNHRIGRQGDVHEVMRSGYAAPLGRERAHHGVRAG